MHSFERRVGLRRQTSNSSRIAQAHRRESGFGFFGLTENFLRSWKTIVYDLICQVRVLWWSRSIWWLLASSQGKKFSGLTWPIYHPPVSPATYIRARRRWKSEEGLVFLVRVCCFFDLSLFLMSLLPHACNRIKFTEDLYFDSRETVFSFTLRAFFPSLLCLLSH